MPLIKPKPRPGPRPKFTTSLEPDVAARLRAYATYIQSSCDYVIGEAVRRLLMYDRDFRAWHTHHAHADAPPDTSAP
ncbi:MAG: hypothetical protein ACRD2X_13410 [Vicinamibacteraceae bacterium]